MDEMSEVLQQILQEFRHLSDNERHEREKMALKLEVEMLRFERRLPQGKTKDEE